MPDYGAPFKPEIASEVDRLEKRVGKRQSVDCQS